jgi:glycosyltransferase involved in cell wall biosynthesis
MPRVSIAVPAYNCERYIAQALQSLLAQTYRDFEIVVSDNASTDRTAEICENIAAADSRVRVVRRKDNIGGPGNFRYAYSLCQGEFIKWSTADDYWDPRYLELCLAELDRQPDVVLCYSKTTLVDADGRRISDYDDNLDLLEESPRRRFNDLLSLIGLCNAHLGVIRRSALARTRLIGNELASDAHFLAELSLYGKFRVVPEHLFFRRYHEQSSSWQRDSAEHQRKYYAPGRSSKFSMQTWKKFGRLYSAVWRSPVPLAQKILLSKDLARSVAWSASHLAAEVRGLLSSGR